MENFIEYDEWCKKVNEKFEARSAAMIVGSRASNMSISDIIAHFER